MKPADFRRSPSGRLAPTVQGQSAFVPNDLPPDIDLAPLAGAIARASQFLGELNGISRTLPDPYLLIRPLQVREALTSSSMEGTFTTLDDLLLLEGGRARRDRRHAGGPELPSCAVRGDPKPRPDPAVAAYPVVAHIACC